MSERIIFVSIKIQAKKKMAEYSNEERYHVAVDCIILGFNGDELKLLLIQRGFEPHLGRWSLMGGFVRPAESLDEAAERILHQLTGLRGVYLEQLKTFGEPDRDSVSRTFSVTYFSLIDIREYEEQLNSSFQAKWFDLNEFPPLIFDHEEMVEEAITQLRYKASLHPILFELLPEKFTMPQLQQLYELVYDTQFDKRNFSRKVLSTGLLIKQKEKDKSSSKRGAFYYTLNKKEYQENFHSFLNFVPNPEKLIYTD